MTPLILMEALAEERPVVAADVGSVHEVLGEGTLRRSRPSRGPRVMAEAVLRVAADPEKARGGGWPKAAAHVRRDFDREGGLEQLWRLVEDLIPARPARRTS